ncbi:ABC-type branched-chain amino acid transport system, periplasmic component [Desulfosporosinus orientis DSM 765]|uniref:ABC-type branched-chain amino acid transport system, periplasmic component n=1 Tax=Desulfosporosinus orientis (strain ATCC 19365 / DSM 765 / NCIMB 8382 / VKM B-1628 / Singapore I) TaxID=768706 RepID=G7WI84_DESOD|nr:amino acid ABC transporter substrate-binding protein [Desulfosporosinus orientis]AET68532.1 ABC-type branched-chain amino acid transport system, periplasmic component [Desulfosporosinus orientis DSM 765]
MFKKFSIKHVLALVMTVGLIGTSAGCGSAPSGGTASSDARDYFKVGVITSLSGAEVEGGNLTKYGYDLWADTVNQKGGIKVGDKSYQVKLVYADDQSDPSAGANAAERMITSEKVDFILGPYTSGVTKAVAPILDKYKVPMITGSAESPSIWTQKFAYTFGTIPAADLTAISPLETLSKVPNPPKTIAILGVNDAFSKAVAEAFKASAEKNGMTVVKYDIVPAGTDFTPLISAWKQLNPDVVAVGGHETEHMQIIKGAKSLGLMPKAFVMHYGITNPDFTKNLGKDADYVFGAAPWTPSLQLQDNLFGTVQDYVKAYQAKYNAVPDYTAAGCSTTGESFMAALAEIGAKPPLSDQQREQLAKALEKTEVNTVFGTIKFATEGNWYHDNVGQKAMVVQMVNGEQVVVGPENMKVKDPIYPVPALNAR